MFCVMNKYISIGECVSKGDNELMGNAEVDKLDAKVRIFPVMAKHTHQILSFFIHFLSCVIFSCPRGYSFWCQTKALPCHFRECHRRMRMMPRRFSSRQKANQIPSSPNPQGIPSSHATPTATVHWQMTPTHTG